MTSQQLSIELFLAICDHLSNDPKTLRAASLTSSEFRQSAQETLFRSYNLNLTGIVELDQKRLTRLQELVDYETTSPRLVSCIRRLSIGFNYWGWSEVDRRRWLRTNGSLVHEFFEILPHGKIQNLVIAGAGRFIGGLQEETSTTDAAGICSQHCERLSSSMVKILCGQNLRTVCIGWGQCISILRHCSPSVKHVFLTGCLSPLELATTPTYASPPVVPSNTLALDSLTCLLHPWNRSKTLTSDGLISGHLPLIHAQSPFALQSLKKLVLESGSVEEIQDILLSAPNLEWLEFDWPGKGASGDPRPSLGIFPSRASSLRHLGLRAFEDTFAKLDPFKGLLSEIRPDPQTHPGAFALEALTIYLSFLPQGVCHLLDGKNFQDDWRPLADFLSNDIAFPKLRQVVVTLSVGAGNEEGWSRGITSNCQIGPRYRNWDGAKPEYVEPMRSALKSLEERGILDFSFKSERSRSFVTQPNVAQ
ncbi:hypothetical protein BKA70DRAFT_1568696 [Coprinopsis sp. MPI-PUGE-AT-0042]|nr:hypothetical protein BKA70DRAFT_1568696 [Coprinopsis sp. MPI-PUGE-AT-0042]